VGARFAQKDILRSILEPSLVISESYQATKIRTIDGETVVGRIVAKGDYRSQKLLVMTDPLRPSQLVEVDKREVESMAPSDVSPMPSGLLDTFTEAEIKDLLTYLSGW
jgi:putative heme-binding domain-containing protein